MAAPKLGNDDEYVDEIGRQVYNLIETLLPATAPGS